MWWKGELVSDAATSGWFPKSYVKVGPGPSPLPVASSIGSEVVSGGSRTSGSRSQTPGSEAEPPATPDEEPRIVQPHQPGHEETGEGAWLPFSPPLSAHLEASHEHDRAS